MLNHTFRSKKWVDPSLGLGKRPIFEKNELKFPKNTVRLKSFIFKCQQKLSNSGHYNLFKIYEDMFIIKKKTIKPNRASF